MNLKNIISSLISLLFTNTIQSQNGLDKYLDNFKKVKIKEVHNQEKIRILNNLKVNTKKTTNKAASPKVSKKEVEEVSKILSLSKLNYSDFEKVSEILFKLSKDETKIEFVFENCITLIDKYNFSEDINYIPFYYFEKSNKISRTRLKNLYLKYLKKVPIKLYGKFCFWWKPNWLDSNEQLDIIRVKYKEIKPIHFDFRNESIYEFTYRLLPLWALNTELKEFYPFLKKISKLPVEYKIKKNDKLYSVDPNTKYATYDHSITQTLNYYTHRNNVINKTEQNLILEILYNMDTYHHPVETEFYASVLFKLQPEKKYKHFKGLFENVSEPSIAEKYWEMKEYDYNHILKWFMDNEYISDIDFIKKRIENRIIDDGRYFLNEKSNVIEILEDAGNVISYDAEYGYVPVKYNDVFQENYRKLIKEVGKIEIIQNYECPNEIYFHFENKFYMLNFNDDEDFVDTISLSYLCNYLLEIKGSKNRIIPILSEDQSSINLYMSLNKIKKIIEKYDITVIN